MKFELNKPIETRVPSIVVDGSLEPGRNRFMLEVIDAAGNRSKPAVVDIIVTRSFSPNFDPNLRVVRPTNPIRVTNPIRPIRRPRT